jgi:hypothetical protein
MLMFDVRTVFVPGPVSDALLNHKVRWVSFLGFYHLLRSVQTLTPSLFDLLKGTEIDDPLRVDRRGISRGRIG